MTTQELREELAEIEHEQWIEWSKALSIKEVLTSDRLTRWHKLWRPYNDLSEEEKDQDRVYADKVLNVLEKYQFSLLAALEGDKQTRLCNHDKEKCSLCDDNDIFNEGIDTAITIIKNHE